jgi:phage tail protein X
LINKKNKLLKKSAYVEMDGFVFTGFPDASTGLPDASTGLPDASTVEFPDASVEPENMLPILPNTPPDVFPDGSVVVFPDGSVEPENMLPKIPDPDVFPDGSVVVFPDGSEENGDERLNASLFDENNALIGVDPFKNDFIVILFQ